MMHLTSVLLPAPFSPIKAWKVPAGTLSEMLSFATNAPNRLVTLTNSRSCGLVGRGCGGTIMARTFQPRMNTDKHGCSASFRDTVSHCNSMVVASYSFVVQLW